ncbi:hypothetical protein CTAM01_14489 [Colletotrichum tamarilloi]|uniref:Uncharacterized protein n=1 Tax=Colletotrichum tamarilloi TaxID=1209934 RepID=A0ABQ9QP34_9PEZI|nr:uncharacterized protein CTAM01_14489 [Colletotrichum tamarilloi]KAK1480219.1 hypothetical protein CTAM01_14489 [Colletotrichum tamarilloi]
MEMEDRESAGTDYVLAMLDALLLAAWSLPLDDSDHLGQGLKYTTGISGAPVQHAILLLRKTERYGDDAVGTRTFSPEKAESRTRWNGPNTGPGPEWGLPSRPPRYLIQKTQCEGCRTRRLHALLDDGEFLSAPPKGQNTTLTRSPGRISRDSSVRRAANEGHSSNKAFALELDPGAPTMERYISKPGATATPAPQATIWP